MSKITIMQMSATPDDVSIDQIKTFEGNLLDIYQDVKSIAMGFTKAFEKTSSKKFSVEMTRNLEGLPSAYIREDGLISNVFFGTYEKEENVRFQSVLGEF
jgi:hypothetical protein